MASLVPPPDTSSQIMVSSSQATSRTVDSAAEATARHYKELLDNERLERQQVERRLRESMDSKGQSPSKLPGAFPFHQLSTALLSRLTLLSTCFDLEFDSHIKRKGESRAQPGHQEFVIHSPLIRPTHTLILEMSGSQHQEVESSRLRL